MAKSMKKKDGWTGVVKKSTPCCPAPKYNSGMKNSTKLRPQSK